MESANDRKVKESRRKKNVREGDKRRGKYQNSSKREREKKELSLLSFFFILNTGRKCSNVPLFFRPSSLRG